MNEEPFIQSSWTKPDEPFEVPLRPQSLADFIGQDNIRERLEVFMQAAKQRGEALGHCLFHGPPGLGKTTLANIIAKTMGTNLVVTSGPVIEKPGDLAGILTNLKEGDVLFIDEIHRMNRSVEEYLYPAMEDFSLDLLIDSGPSARSVQVTLNPFTLVGATTRAGLLSGPMRSRFALSLRLDYYSPDFLEKILMRSGQHPRRVDCSGWSACHCGALPRDSAHRQSSSALGARLCSDQETSQDRSSRRRILPSTCSKSTIAA